MRRIYVEQIQHGMLLARTIYGSGGQVLLKAGAELKPHYAKYLRRLGINNLYVQDKRLIDVEVDDVIAEETRLEARTLVREIMEASSNNHKNNICHKSLSFQDEKITRTVTKIIEELFKNDEVIINLVDIRSIEDYTFAHSVNTCVLASLTAAKLKCTLGQMEKIATGCLLHDLGNVAIPGNILKKRSRLTREEYEVIKNHPTYGYEMFKRSSLFSSAAGAVIYEHHELQNGQGYPRGLKGNQIDLLAQVTTVADVYDALTSDRPYRKAFQPHQAVEMLSALSEDYFNLDILRTFLSLIAAYPVGTHVLLSSGESGLVIGNTPGFPLRPKVRILYEGERFAHHPSPYDIDLTETLDLVIERVIN